VVALAACTGGDPEPGREIPEAIFLISLDTLRADYLNLYGYERFQTSPVLDGFARESVVFDNCIVASPRTLTSHMSLMTGLHAHHHRVDEKVPLDEGAATLASMLQSRGWGTRGWADGGYLAKRWGFDRGFDGYESRPRRGFAAILPEAMAWLNKNSETPFFVFLHTYDVHNTGLSPFYRAPPPFRSRFSAGLESALRAGELRDFTQRYWARKDSLTEQDRNYVRATYAEGVRHVDEQLGSFFRFLRERRLYDRSLIVVWSDHGEGLFDHDEWSHGQVYDHTIRCALLMKIPGVAGGRRVQSVVSGVDLLPTLLDLAGAPVPTTLDGRSVVPEIFDDTSSGVAFSLRTKMGQRLFSIRTTSHHLFWDGERDVFHFFDLVSDPGEARNLSPSGTETEASLRARLEEWVRTHDEALQRARVSDELLSDDADEELRALGYLE
jgi:arylsulfatase